MGNACGLAVGRSIWAIWYLKQECIWWCQWPNEVRFGDNVWVFGGETWRMTLAILHFIDCLMGQRM